MSRSRKKNPVVTYVNCKSQKKGKRQCNKRVKPKTRCINLYYCPLNFRRQ